LASTGQPTSAELATSIFHVVCQEDVKWLSL